VAEPQPALLEFGLRARLRPRGETGCCVFQRDFSGEHPKDLVSIVLPIGCGVEIGTRLHSRGKYSDEHRLQQAPLVMACLWPWIGKEDMHAGKRAPRKHLFDYFDRVMLDHAHVGEMEVVQALQDAANAWRMDLDPEIIDLRMRRRDFCRGFPHAESDFEHLRRVAPEHLFEIHRCTRKGNAVKRRELAVSARLTRRGAALTQYKAADRTLRQVDLDAMTPAVGELGLAE
jgi:hypothetical protein